MARPKNFSYSNEAEFIDRFLVPLLQRLGFSMIANTHGASEQGRDLIFAEIDRFGHTVFHAMQAKYVDLIGQGRATDDIISDCRQAFATAFTHPNTNTQERISRFYVANGGSISKEARDYFFGTVERAFSANAVLLDGSTLLQLDRWATANRIQDIGAILNGLLIEIRINRHMAGLLHPHFASLRALNEGAPRIIFVETLRDAAVSSYIQKPILSGQLDTNIVFSYWDTADKVNKLKGGMGAAAHENLQWSTSHCAELLNQLERLAAVIESQIHTIFQTLAYPPA